MITDEKESESSADETSSQTEEGSQKEENSNAESEIDYKAEAERWKARFEERTKALVRISKAHEAKAKEKPEKEIDADADDEQDVSSVVRSALKELKKEQALETVSSVLESISENEDERDLIKFIYDRRMTPSGYSRKDIENDLIDAKLLANRKKFETEIAAKAEKQARKALAETVAMSNNASATSGRKPPVTGDADNFTAEERALIDSYKNFSKRNSH